MAGNNIKNLFSRFDYKETISRPGLVAIFMGSLCIFSGSLMIDDWREAVIEFAEGALALVVFVGVIGLFFAFLYFLRSKMAKVFGDGVANAVMVFLFFSPLLFMLFVMFSGWGRI